MSPSVTYTHCAKSSKEQTGNIITSAQVKEGGLLYETRNDAESGNESDEDSIMPQLLRKNKWMQWILEMGQMMILYLLRC